MPYGAIFGSSLSEIYIHFNQLHPYIDLNNRSKVECNTFYIFYIMFNNQFR